MSSSMRRLEVSVIPPSLKCDDANCLAGASIALGTIPGSKTTNILWQVNDKSGEQITNYKTVAYVGGT